MYFELVAELITPLLLLCCRLVLSYERLTRPRVTASPHQVLDATFGSLDKERIPISIMAGMLPWTSRAPYPFVAAHCVEGRITAPSKQLSHVMEASCGRRKGGKMLTRTLAAVRYLYLVAILVQPSSTNADGVVSQSTRIKPNMYRPLRNSHTEEMHSLDNDTNNSRLLQQKAFAAGTPGGKAPIVELQDFSTSDKT